MSGQIENLLRVMVPGNKEAVITAVPVTLIPTLFESQLVNGFSRKKIRAYNNSHANSGECYYGYDSQMHPTENSIAIPKKAFIEIPVASSIPIYFVCISGELGDVRVEEIA
jgi:hypothetical protein